MKSKFIVIVIFAAMLSSCRKEYASFSRTNYYQESNNSQEAMLADGMENNISLKESEEKKIQMNIENKTSVVSKKSIGINFSKKINKGVSSAKLLLKSREDVKKIKKINKERDPRYVRALIMTIFGGLATALGILAINVAPTGLFIFIFGLIFIVGLVSLLMYWSNPKPTM